MSNLPPEISTSMRKILLSAVCFVVVGGGGGGAAAAAAAAASELCMKRTLEASQCMESHLAMHKKPASAQHASCQETGELSMLGGCFFFVFAKS